MSRVIKKMSDSVRIPCNFCKKTFLNKRSLNGHYKSIHNVHKRMPKYNYKCLEPLCNQSFIYNNSFIKHLREDHGKIIEEINFQLKNRDEFEAWMARVEDQLNVRYQLTKKGPFTYLKCSRNKSYYAKRDMNDTTTVYKRKLKKQGYSVMDINCTSKIRVIDNEDGCEVHWVKTHYGHKEEPEHIRLSKNHRNLLKTCLESGIKPRRIIQLIQDSNKETSNRLGLISAQQVQNIKKKYNIVQQTTIENEKEDCAIFTELYNKFINSPVESIDPTDISYESNSRSEKDNLVIALQNLIQKLTTSGKDQINPITVKLIYEAVIEFDKMLTENTENSKTAIPNKSNIIVTANNNKSLGTSEKTKPKKNFTQKMKIKKAKTTSEKENATYIVLETPKFSNFEYVDVNDESNYFGTMYQNVMGCDEIPSEHDETARSTVSISSEVEIKTNNDNSKKVFKRTTSAQRKQKQKSKIRKSKYDVNKFLDVMPNILLETSNFSSLQKTAVSNISKVKVKTNGDKSSTKVNNNPVDGMIQDDIVIDAAPITSEVKAETFEVPTDAIPIASEVSIDPLSIEQFPVRLKLKPTQKIKNPKKCVKEDVSEKNDKPVLVPEPMNFSKVPHPIGHDYCKNVYFIKVNHGSNFFYLPCSISYK